MGCQHSAGPPTFRFLEDFAGFIVSGSQKVRHTDKEE